MMTLKAADGVKLHTANTKTVKKEMKASQSANLVVGEMLVFDAHKVHWVDIPEKVLLKGKKSNAFSEPIGEGFRNDLSIMICTEVCDRPSRSEAETLLADYLRDKTPNFWCLVEHAPTVETRARPFKP